MTTGERTVSNIVVAVEAEINVLERRLGKLREIRHLAVELDGARLPAAAAPIKEAQPKAAELRRKYAPRSALKVEDVLDTARDVLADGPTTVAQVFHAIGKSPTGRSPKQKATVEEALQRLGAVKTDSRGHGGTTVWALPEASNGTAEIEPEPESDLEAEIEQAYQERHKPDPVPVAARAVADAASPSDEDLVAKVLELTASSVGWSDGELRYQLKRRHGMDVPMPAVQKAREVATLRRMKARAGVGTAGRAGA